MKFAAFISIIISVAVMFAACQGAVGPQGPKGDTGDTGDTGDAGPAGEQGPEGVGTLTLSGKTEAPILLSHVTRNNQKVIGAQKEDVDITSYFRGGKDPVTYELVPPNADPAHEDNNDTVFDNESVFKAEVNKDTGALTISARSATAAIDAGSYTTGETVTFRAVDGDKIKSDSVNLMVKANREPTIVAANQDDAVIELTVGMQNATDATRDGLDDKGKKLDTQPNPVCATFGSCVYSIKLNGATDTPSNAAIFLENPEGGDNTDAQVVASDDDTAGMTLSVVSHDEEVQVSADGTTLTVVGLKSTFSDDSDNTNDFASVTIKVIDADGLFVERDLAVIVDTPPEVKSTFESSYSFPRGNSAVNVVVGLAAHFKDVDDATLTYVVKSSDDAKVAFPTSYTDGGVDGADLQVIPRNIGSSTITVTATDGRGQTAEQSFTVRVTAPTTS